MRFKVFNKIRCSTRLCIYS